MTILVTGAAGFIGYHMSQALLARGERVLGIDNLNDYYAVSLKRDRIAEIQRRNADNFRFVQVDFADHVALEAALADSDITRIVHLGAQAGVRYSIRQSARLHAKRISTVSSTSSKPAERHATWRISSIASTSPPSMARNEEAAFLASSDNVDHPLSACMPRRRRRTS